MSLLYEILTIYICNCLILNNNCHLAIAVNIKKYQIVEFINEHEDDNVSLDYVPSKWVTYDEQLRSCVCKFMPSPYTTKTRIKLNNIINENNEAPESWPSYPVYLRGEAETIEEANKKLRAINKKQYFYSTDNDNHAENNVKRCTKFFKKKAKRNSENAIDKILYNSDIGTRNSSNESNSSTTTTNDQSEYTNKQSKTLLKKKNKKKKIKKNNIEDTEAILSTSAISSNINNTVASNITKQFFTKNVQHIENDKDVTFPAGIYQLF
ncbi:hypothetical protein PUN28_012866 [Cardiocondyla obscurior]|uniref:Uncharacterized protein n=1 Tax=Cardiocondyla obscurior TaxID=286306 RepID=A0AAW2F7Q1_9HYME